MCFSFSLVKFEKSPEANAGLLWCTLTLQRASWSRTQEKSKIFLHYKNFSQIRKHFFLKIVLFSIYGYIYSQILESLFYMNRALMWLSLESGCLTSVSFMRLLFCLANSTHPSSSDTNPSLKASHPRVLGVWDHSLLSGYCMKIVSSDCVYLYVDVQVHSTSWAGILSCFSWKCVTSSFIVELRAPSKGSIDWYIIND